MQDGAAPLIAVFVNAARLGLFATTMLVFIAVFGLTGLVAPSWSWVVRRTRRSRTLCLFHILLVATRDLTRVVLLLNLPCASLSFSAA